MHEQVTRIDKEGLDYTRQGLKDQKIELPPDAKALNADPEPEKLSSEAVEYTTKLQIDRRFEVVLQSDD